MSEPLLATDFLVGANLDRGWKIVEKLDLPSGSTGGNFSVGFLAKNENGQTGFVKALDIGKIMRSFGAGALNALEFFLDSFNYEKQILAKCADKGMSRIVRILDSGYLEVDEPGLQYPRVDYIICEIADGDVRNFLKFSDKVDLVWRFHCLHHVALGIQQLHGAQIAHQDLKPSNVLIFSDSSEAKLADLGRAVDKLEDAPYEDLDIPGDRDYAPPELLYGFVPSDWARRRLACDLYHLGSLVFFLFSGVHAVTAMISETPKSHQPYHFSGVHWSGPFEEVIPYLEEALSRNLSDLRRHLNITTSKEIADELTTVLGWLCAPDPAKRGHPRDRNTRTPYSAQRFVGIFNRLSAAARVNLTKEKQ